MKTNEELLRKEEEEISKTLALSLEEYNEKQKMEQEQAKQQSLLYASNFSMEEDWDEMLQEAIRQSILGSGETTDVNRSVVFTRYPSVDYNDSHFNIVKNHFIKMSFYLCNTYEKTKDRNDVIDNKLFWKDIYKYYKGIFLIIKNYIMCLIKRAQTINDYMDAIDCSGSSSDSRRRRRFRKKHFKTHEREDKKQEKKQEGKEKGKEEEKQGENQGEKKGRNNSSSSSSSGSSSNSSSNNSSSDIDSSNSDGDDSDTSESSSLSIRSLEDVKVAYAPINYTTKQYCKWLRKGNRCSKLNDHVYLYYLLQNMTLYEDSDDIHNLVFGVNNYKYANKTDISKWFNHNLSFNEHEHINFGLRQFLNGPCGLISSVQGYLIIILLFNHKYNFLWGSDYFNVLKTNPDFMNFTNDLMGTGENVDSSMNEDTPEETERQSSAQRTQKSVRENTYRRNKNVKNVTKEPCVKGKSSMDSDEKNSDNEDEVNENMNKDIEDDDSDKELLALVCDNIKDLKYYCLVESLAYILYQCTEKSHYVVAFVLPECYDFYCYIDKKRQDAGYFRDLKKVAVYYREFTNIKDVIIFYLEHFILFSCATGVISFLYSVILTRGVENIRNDMDDVNHPLIGIYGHCSQELVNLLLTGRACSNVFDNTNVINNDQNETQVNICENENLEAGNVTKEKKGEGVKENEDIDKKELEGQERGKERDGGDETAKENEEEKKTKGNEEKTHEGEQRSENAKNSKKTGKDVKVNTEKEKGEEKKAHEGNNGKENTENQKETGKDVKVNTEKEEGEGKKTHEGTNGDEKEKNAEHRKKEGDNTQDNAKEIKKNVEKENGSKDNIVLKGISKRPLIGLLTDFEAFKYCEVGNFYKYPVYPIWVISSSSHYTVLFSLNIRNSKCTSEELIKKQMDTVWKKYDTENNKYIAAQSIPDFLKELKVTEEYKSTFENFTNDCGVLLYSEFKQFYLDLKKKEINSLKGLDPPKDKYFYLYDAKEMPENSIHYFHLKEVDYDVSSQNYLSFFNTRWPNNTVELLNCRIVSKGK